MTHDPMCEPWFDDDEEYPCPGCDLIARVRADERGQIQAVLDGFPDDYYDERFGYAVGLVRDHLAARGGDA